ncbi:hypothetical protein ANACOL_02218 [Anaerotruncus colihominis DSM 17241]|uniref:Uncharacterized protein n=1 Tax=Anaerotruncus colihominis DSM 17241 TaxID=445972 RepID=B0PBR0_9FIRM|nr:hypothetical protein ANACOL_02218 [Anaerotruncus colihominis DSM 17241]
MQSRTLGSYIYMYNNYNKQYNENQAIGRQFSGGSQIIFQRNEWFLA